MKYLFRLFSVLIILCFGLTLLPLWKVDHWLVRLWDFPRVQILVVTVIALIGAAFCHRWSAATRLYCSLLGVIAGIVILAQGALIAPYTPAFAREVASVNATARIRAPRDCVNILVANVYMENRDAVPLVQTIDRNDPDIVLVVENDGWWSEQLAPVAANYPTVVDRPQDNTYGLLFMTRLDAEDVALEYLIKDDIPSITALLRLPDSARQFHFHGLHPEPPMVGQDSTPRDRELLHAAERVRKLGLPAIIGGDLNDVAWSHTTRLFRRVSEALDPRVGRGTYSSFNAKYPFIRWPLDHIFHTDEFELRRLQVLPGIKSDHFPLYAELCFAGEKQEHNEEAEPMDAADAKELEETLYK